MKKTKEFQFFIPVKIFFGENKVEEIGKISKTFGSKALLVLGKSAMLKENVVSKVSRFLEDEGITIEKFNGVGTNPRIEKILEGAKIAKRFKPDTIIGIGGGSVIDTAKAISLAATHEGDLWEYRIRGKLGIEKIEDKMIPIITVPTAFGTGAEITPAAVISKDTSKEVIVSPYMFPKVALIDPTLSLTLPSELTARIGIDAFIQGMEAFVSTNATPMSDIFAIEAIKLSYQYLPICVLNGKNIEARSYQALAALFGGFAISLAGVGAVHALAVPLSGRYNIHHGYALSLILLEVMRHNLDACRARYARLAEILGASKENMNEEELAEEAINRVKLFLENLGLYPPKRLREFGVKEQELRLLAKESLNPDMTTNPKKMTEEEIVDIFQNLL
jgi:alcohol dehydrogenase class IV